MGFSESSETATVSTPVVIDMQNFGKEGVLTTREAGDKAAQEILRRVEKAGPGDPIAFDFSDVRAISVPFAERAFGLLLSGRLGGYFDDHPLLAVNATEDVRETLAAALRPRRLALLSLSDDGPELLGGDEVLNMTLQAAQKLDKEFSVIELARELEITVQAANNRLRTLVISGVLSRDRIIPTRGGKEFRYAFPDVPVSTPRTRAKKRTPRQRRRTPLKTV